MDVFDHCSHLLVKQCYDQSKIKIQIVVADKNVRKALIGAFVQIGGEHKKSKAHRSALEDQLSLWLQSLQLELDKED